MGNTNLGKILEQPLLVQLLFHPESVEARRLAKVIHHQLNDDLVAPGLRVPKVFSPFGDGAHPLADQGLDFAAHSFVAVLADDQLVEANEWTSHAADVWEACRPSPHRCVPVQLSPNAGPLDDRLEEVGFIKAFLQPDAQRNAFVVWYSGRIPGVLDEVLLLAIAGQPVFLIGPFGGAAALAIDLLQGKPSPEATWDYQKQAPFAVEMGALYESGGLAWMDYPEIAALLQSKGFAGINPLLCEAEHLELFPTVDSFRIVEIILQGLNRLSCASLLSR